MNTLLFEFISYSMDNTIRETIDGKEVEIKEEIEISRETFNNLKAYDTVTKRLPSTRW